MARNNKNKLYPMRPCEYCWETFEPHKSTQKYCNEECQKKASNLRDKKRRIKNIIKGTGGAYLRLRFKILNRDNFTCQYCGRTVEDGIKLEIDHIHPESKGGKTTIDNLIVSCNLCNIGKFDVLLSLKSKEHIKNRISNK